MVAIGSSGGEAIVIGVDWNRKAIGVDPQIDARRLGGGASTDQRESANPAAR
jgi:hypothetical protein